jgi:alanyl-tRNA synthetase
VSVQENVKLKQVEQLIRDKAKRIQNRIDATNQEINGVQFLAVGWILTRKELKIWLMIWEIRTNMFWFTADEDKPMLSCYISKELVADKIKCRASSP